jgi:multimeric flavodoxin WrbA
MKPNDENGKLPTSERPFRVLVISGSDRRQYNCPGVDSKSRTLMLRMAERLPQEWEIDMQDLGNVYARARIQSCNACASTSMALCVWPCNCYEKNDKSEPDLMWDLDMYSRLDLADAWAIIGPINWYAPSSNLKLMFDRLVCMNGGNPREELIAHKDPEKAMALEHSPEWEDSPGGAHGRLLLLRGRGSRRDGRVRTPQEATPQALLPAAGGAIRERA